MNFKITVDESAPQFAEVALNSGGLGILPDRRTIFEEEWTRPEFGFIGHPTEDGSEFKVLSYARV